MSAAIVTSGLGKEYGRVSALVDLSLRVELGEIFGFLGPNGAGKTTTIRLLLGLLRSTAGAGTVLGRDVRTHGTSVRSEIGYLPGELALWPGLSGWHTLRFLERLTGRAALDRAPLLERLGLSEADLRRPVRTYSDGMKRKLGLVQALQCRPRLAFLDEPTKGLDPLAQQSFYDVLMDARRGGMTIFLSSHVLSEVERVCDRVGMLRAGRLVSLGAIGTVLASQRRRVHATFSGPVADDALPTAGEVVARSPTSVDLLVARADVASLVRQLGALPLADLTIEPASLEDAFLELYR